MPHKLSSTELILTFKCLVSFAQMLQPSYSSNSQQNLLLLQHDLEERNLQCTQLQSSVRRLEEELAEKKRSIGQLQQKLAVAEEGQATSKWRLEEATESFKVEEIQSVRETSKRVKEEAVMAVQPLAADTVDQLQVQVGK